MNVTRMLAHWVAQSTWDSVPSAMRAESVRCWVNWLGCVLGGSRHETVTRAIAAYAPFAGPAQAAVLGRAERTDALTAAMLNAIANTVHTFDDTHVTTVAHPGGAPGAVLCALADMQVVSGRDFLHAMVLGVEIQCRLAVAIAAPPAQCTVALSTLGATAAFGGAAAAGRIIGLSEEQLMWAFGLAATTASGTRATHGSMASLFIPGHGARNGLVAACLAREGFTGGETSIESPNGFAALFGRPAHLPAAVDGLGERFEMTANAYKPYPCGVVCHPAIDACLDLAARSGFSAARVQGIALRMNPLALALADKPQPKDRLHALVSVQHWVACALLRGRAGIEEGSDACVHDAAIAALRDRVRLTADADVASGAAYATATLNDGSEWRADVPFGRGTLERPMSDKELDDKFLAQAQFAMPLADARRLLDCARGIEAADDVGEILRGIASHIEAAT